MRGMSSSDKTFSVTQIQDSNKLPNRLMKWLDFKKTMTGIYMQVDESKLLFGRVDKQTRQKTWHRHTCGCSYVSTVFPSQRNTR